MSKVAVLNLSKDYSRIKFTPDSLAKAKEAQRLAYLGLLGRSASDAARKLEAEVDYRSRKFTRAIVKVWDAVSAIYEAPRRTTHKGEGLAFDDDMTREAEDLLKETMPNFSPTHIQRCPDDNLAQRLRERIGAFRERRTQYERLANAALRNGPSTGLCARLNEALALAEEMANEVLTDPLGNRCQEAADLLCGILVQHASPEDAHVLIEMFESLKAGDGATAREILRGILVQTARPEDAQALMNLFASLRAGDGEPTIDPLAIYEGLSALALRARKSLESATAELNARKNSFET